MRGSDFITSAETVNPLSVSFLTRVLPRKPVAPVTRYFVYISSTPFRTIALRLKKTALNIV